MNDISNKFKLNEKDSQIATHILQYESTPKAITEFSELSINLTDYAYWFILSTLWVSCSGYADLNLWRRLFRSGRPKRSLCIMKPSELAAFERLPEKFITFRAHRPNETDWISYTLDIEIAKRFASERNTEVTAYTINKQMMGMGRLTTPSNANPWNFFSWHPKKYQQAHNIDLTKLQSYTAEELLELLRYLWN
jgi:hypothetical protein